MFDTILRGGRLIDPSQDIDTVCDIAFSEGRVAKIAPRIAESAGETHDASGQFVCPGLIDLHTHVYWGATSIGVEPDLVHRRSATTTLIDAGSAGPGNFPGLRKYVIEPSPVRILSFLNISFAGIFAYSRSVMVGECTDIRLLDQAECLRVARAHPDIIVGIKVRVGKATSGANGLAPLKLAIDVAEESGLPVMAHIDNPPPTRREVLECLRPGDILTHCFKPFPNAPIRSNGEIWNDVLTARERGIIYDIGHGTFSFGFDVARGMLAKGFIPDVISSDVHSLNIDGPAFDLMTTLSKFYALGLDLKEIVRCATENPAAAIRHTDLGSLRVGAIGDATLFDIENGEFEYVDAVGARLRSAKRLRALVTVIGGQLRPLDSQRR